MKAICVSDNEDFLQHSKSRSALLLVTLPLFGMVCLSLQPPFQGAISPRVLIAGCFSTQPKGALNPKGHSRGRNVSLSRHEGATDRIHLSRRSCHSSGSFDDRSGSKPVQRDHLRHSMSRAPSVAFPQLTPSLRGGEADEAIQGPRPRLLDCFATLAMTLVAHSPFARKLTPSPRCYFGNLSRRKTRFADGVRDRSAANRRLAP